MEKTIITVVALFGMYQAHKNYQQTGNIFGQIAPMVPQLPSGGSVITTPIKQEPLMQNSNFVQQQNFNTSPTTPINDPDCVDGTCYNVGPVRG